MDLRRADTLALGRFGLGKSQRSGLIGTLRFDRSRRVHVVLRGAGREPGKGVPSCESVLVCFWDCTASCWSFPRLRPRPHSAMIRQATRRPVDNRRPSPRPTITNDCSDGGTASSASELTSRPMTAWMLEPHQSFRQVRRSRGRFWLLRLTRVQFARATELYRDRS